MPYVWAPPTTYILPPWELTPASCRGAVIGVLADQELWATSYTSFLSDAETPSVPPMAYTLSPEWPATKLVRPFSIGARVVVQVFVCGSYISTSFVTPVLLHPP